MIGLPRDDAGDFCWSSEHVGCLEWHLVETAALVAHVDRSNWVTWWVSIAWTTEPLSWRLPVTITDDYYYFYLMTIFPGEPGSGSSPMDPRLHESEPQGINGMVFMGWMSLLPLTH